MDKDKIQHPAVQELLRRGRVDVIMTPTQKKFFNFVDATPQIYFAMLSCRKMGKSFAALLAAFGYCLREPNIIGRIVLPTFKQGKDVAYPILREFQDIFPKDVFPVLRKSEASLYFHNGSVLHISGSNAESCEGNRGPRADFLILDEVTAFDSSVFGYLLRGILLPQISLAKNPKIICTGTPARDPFHPFYIYEYPKLKAAGTLMTFTIDDNTLLNEKQKADIIELYGSRDNSEFRREFLCELISADNLRVVPEFTLKKHVFSGDIKEQLRDCAGDSSEWDGIISCDLGVTDLTGIVGLIVNSYTGKAVVCFERTMHGNTLGEFAEVYKSLYETMKLYCRNITSIVDCFEQSMITLRKDHKLEFQRPMKRSVEDNVAVMRNIFARDKITVHDSCRYLITQLTSGLWDENKKVNKDFARSPIVELSHLDHLVSLAYALRRVNFGGSFSKDLILGDRNKPNKKLTNRFSNATLPKDS